MEVCRAMAERSARKGATLRKELSRAALDAETSRGFAPELRSVLGCRRGATRQVRQIARSCAYPRISQPRRVNKKETCRDADRME